MKTKMEIKIGQMAYFYLYALDRILKPKHPYIDIDLLVSVIALSTPGRYEHYEKK